MREDEDATRVIYQGSFFSIGQFRRGPKHEKFAGIHQIGGRLVVFPRTSVTITHAGQDAVVADPNKVMFYNDGQVYSRGKRSDQGDLCDGNLSPIHSIRFPKKLRAKFSRQSQKSLHNDEEKCIEASMTLGTTRFIHKKT